MFGGNDFRQGATPSPKKTISIVGYVITEPCIGTKDKSCVDVCPVDCIHGADEDPQLYIDPEESAPTMERVIPNASKPRCFNTSLTSMSSYAD